MIRALALGALIAVASAGVARAGTVTGSARGADVIWISSGVATTGAIAEMRNRDKTFVPPLLVVPAGAEVRFPNDDPFYHSIYSISAADPFDIGYYGPGPGKVVAFPHAGIVRVHCHIHASMSGTIVVVDGPATEPLGPTFALTDVPPGTWTLHFWSDAAGERTERVTVR